MLKEAAQITVQRDLRKKIRVNDRGQVAVSLLNSTKKFKVVLFTNTFSPFNSPCIEITAANLFDETLPDKLVQCLHDLKLGCMKIIDIKP